MDKTLKIFIASLVGVIVLIILLDGMRVKPVNWQPTYSLDKKNPLDLYIFNQEVEHFFPAKTFHRINTTFYQYLWENKDIPRNYLIIKSSAYQELDTAMLNSVKKGSNLFVNAEFTDSGFLDSLGITCTDLSYMAPLTDTDSVQLHLTMSDWKNKSLKILKE